MLYEKQTFIDDYTVLKAEHLEHIEDGIYQNSVDKLDVEQLPIAIDEALAKAKASGSFNGKDGKNGKDGEDGYTPVRGVDYWTEEDKDEIESYIDSALSDLPSGGGISAAEVQAMIDAALAGLPSVEELPSAEEVSF